MAIYSCNLASIGRTTHAAGTAGAHLRYIARPDAEPVLDAHVIPRDPVEARTWMDRQEASDRKNGRVLDKIRIALPRELTKMERLELVRDFCRGLTDNRVPWMFAIHQEGKDADNPHAHVVVRDRDLETGKRVLRLSDSAREREALGLEPKAVEWIRIKWEEHANAALERAGHEARVDRRTLDAQGIEREPTIHIGVKAAMVDGHIHRPRSRRKTNALGREIDYPAIDQGRTRKERHAEIVDLNLERAARSPDLETRAWAKFEKSQRAADRRLEAELVGLTRDRTSEERRVRSVLRDQKRALREERQTTQRQAKAEHRAAAGPRLAALRAQQTREREALKVRQSAFWRRLACAVDITGGARRRREDARRALVAAHRDERTELALETRAQWLESRAEIDAAFAPREATLNERRHHALDELRDTRRRVDAMIEARLQLRERDRERERREVQRALSASRAVQSGRDEGRDRPAPGRGR